MTQIEHIGVHMSLNHCLSLLEIQLCPTFKRKLDIKKEIFLINFDRDLVNVIYIHLMYVPIKLSWV